MPYNKVVSSSSASQAPVSRISAASRRTISRGTSPIVFENFSTTQCGPSSSTLDSTSVGIQTTIGVASSQCQTDFADDVCRKCQQSKQSLCYDSSEEKPASIVRSKNRLSDLCSAAFGTTDRDAEHPSSSFTPPPAPPPSVSEGLVSTSKHADGLELLSLLAEQASQKQEEYRLSKESDCSSSSNDEEDYSEDGSSVPSCDIFGQDDNSSLSIKRERSWEMTLSSFSSLVDKEGAEKHVLNDETGQYTITKFFTGNMILGLCEQESIGLSSEVYLIHMCM